MSTIDWNSLAAEVVALDEKQQGSAGHGLSVQCSPDSRDSMIVESASRTNCLLRPYPTCSACPHSTFTLVFKPRETKLEQVACPRWAEETDRLGSKAPSSYITTEAATCQDSPFPFCVSCPSVTNVARSGADKRLPGWYGRWNRLRKEEFEDE
jgi:hypothetical protein